jgi:flagellar hook assembly protein FlgD
LAFEPPRPNPADRQIRLGFSLATGGRVDLSVFDLSGRVVRRLLDRFAEPGRREVTWDGRDANDARVPAGVYLVRLSAEGRELVRRVIVMP